MMRKALGCFVFLLLLSVLPMAAEDSPRCGAPLPENQDIFTTVWSSAEYSWCPPWENCWEPHYSTVKERAEKYGGDIWLQEYYLGLTSQVGPEDSNSLRRSFVTAAEESPGNPVAQYLAAMAAWRGGDKVRLLARALEIDPDFGLAHLEMSRILFRPRPIQNKEELEKKHGTVEDHLGKYLELCPDRPYVALWFHEVGDKDFWNSHAPQLRYVADRFERPRGLRRYAEVLKGVWAVESRILTLEEFRGRLSSDLLWLRRMEEGDNLIILSALDEAYKKLEDFESQEEIRDRIVKSFPCTSEWREVERERYHESHGGDKHPLGMTVSEAREYQAQVNRWLAECPDHVAVAMWSGVPVAQRLIEEMDNREFEGVERYYLRLWPEIRSSFRTWVFSSPYYIFPAERARRGIATLADEERMRQAIAAQERWETDLGQVGWTQDQIPVNREQAEVGRAVTAVRAAAELAQVRMSVDVNPGDRRARWASDALEEVSAEFELASKHQGDPEIYQVDLALSRYWSAKGQIARNLDHLPDAHAFFSLAEILQPGEGIDRDSRLKGWLDEIGTAHLEDVVMDAMLQTSLYEWPGSQEGADAWNQYHGIKVVRDRTQETAKQGVEWVWLDSPVNLPEFSLKEVNAGTEVHSEALKEVTLLNFWATWCPPCQVELPLLSQVAAWAETQGWVRVVAVSIDSDQGLVRPYLSKKKLVFPTVLYGEPYFREVTEDQDLKEVFEGGVPQTWLVVNGQVRAILEGFDGRDTSTWVVKTQKFLEEARQLN